MDVVSVGDLADCISAGLIQDGAGLFARPLRLAGAELRSAVGAHLDRTEVGTPGLLDRDGFVDAVVSALELGASLELASPPDFRAVLDDCATVRTAFLRIVHQVPLKAAEWLRRVSGHLSGLEYHLGPSGVAPAFMATLDALSVALDEPLPGGVAERLRLGRQAVEAARVRLGPVVRELAGLDIDAVETITRAVSDAAASTAVALGLDAWLDRTHPLDHVGHGGPFGPGGAALWGTYPVVVVVGGGPTHERVYEALSVLDAAAPAARLAVVESPAVGASPIEPVGTAVSRWAVRLRERGPYDPEVASPVLDAAADGVIPVARAVLPATSAVVPATSAVVFWPTTDAMETRHVAAAVAGAVVAARAARRSVLVVSVEPCHALEVSRQLDLLGQEHAVDPSLSARSCPEPARVSVTTVVGCDGLVADLVILVFPHGSGRDARPRLALDATRDGVVAQLSGNGTVRSSWGPHRLVTPRTAAHHGLECIAAAVRAATEHVVIVGPSDAGTAWSLAAERLVPTGADVVAFGAPVQFGAAPAPSTSELDGPRPQRDRSRPLAARDRRIERGRRSASAQGDLFDLVHTADDEEVDRAIRALVAVTTGAGSAEGPCASSS